MGFELVRRNGRQPGRRHGPAKIAVFHADNSRSTITLSAATRDWLEPTPGSGSARWPANLPSMKVSLLVDEPARRLMIRRLEDTAEGDHVYQVGGFGGSAQAYISDYGLEDTLGLLAGHYLCDLVEDGPDNTRAAVIALDERTQPRTRKP